MATNALTWGSTETIEWRAEFYETMAAAERALLKAVRATNHSLRLNVQGLALRRPISHVSNETEKLLVVLEKLDRIPSVVFLQDDAKMIPEALQDLFKKTCFVIQETESIGLNKTYFLKG